MSRRVSVPDVFLRGNRYYVRVQVPKHMQFKVRKREQWLSLRTNHKTVALSRAITATQTKRWEIEEAYKRLSGIRETMEVLTDKHSCL